MKSNSISSILRNKESMIPFFLILFYLFFEYGRPQILLPFLSYLKLPTLTIAVLGMFGIYTGRFKWKDKQTILYIILLGFMVIHGPIAANNYWALMVFIAMIYNFIAYLSISNLVDNQQKIEKLVKVWLAIHIFLAVIGIINKGRGIGGFLGDENDFCMTLNMIIPFSFFLALSVSGKERIYYILITFLFIFVIFLTESRGGFVGLCVMFLYCWLRTKRKVITAVFVSFLVVFAILIAPAKYWDEMRSITEEGASAGTGEERVYEWNIGWHMFLDNPIMGVGQGNFPWNFKKYELEVTGSDEPFYGRSVAGRAAHSIYFTLLPELGLIGLILFSGMLYFNIKDLQYVKNNSIINKNNNKTKQFAGYYYHMALALEGSIISYLVSGAFISILYYPNFWILMGFIISLKKNYISGVENYQSVLT